MEFRTHFWLWFPAHIWPSWLRRFASDILTYSKAFRFLWLESELEISVILASYGKIFLENLTYIISMSFLFSLLHVETIGECTKVRYFEDWRYLGLSNKRFKFLATLLEGLEYDFIDRHRLLECFEVSGHVVVPKHTYLFKHKKSLEVARPAFFFFYSNKETIYSLKQHTY